MSRKPTRKGPGLVARLDAGPVICAEGYLFELERRGYLQAGAYVPEVVLEHPELVEQLHREFVHAGSDVVEAFTYYAHRQKLRVIGREADLEPMNRTALAIARKVAKDTGAMVAGNICNTTIYDPQDKASVKKVRAIFDEQIAWAVEAGVDFIIGETFAYAQEAMLALDAIKAAGQVAVINMAAHRNVTREEWSWGDAARRLEQAGADVVGLNCTRGPRTMMPLLKQVRKAVKCHVSALPVPYRTTRLNPSFQSIIDKDCDLLPEHKAFPIALDPFTCNRFEIAEFAAEAYAMNVRFLGVCCGAGPHHVRAMAEAVGRTPPASRYSADMSKHYLFGKTTLGKGKRLKEADVAYAKTIAPGKS